jgi:DMSO/TMAO reductase YedYZ molybdopterin-dependent catalytic subunit
MDEVHVVSAPSEEVENREIAPAGLAYAITPVELHFVRNHFPTPATPATIDTVEIGGAVAAPARIRGDDLHRMTTRTLPVTLECAGTGRAGMMPLPPGEPWKRGAVSTAVWSGVPLRLLLERAGLRDDVVAILAVGGDSFERALPIAAALDPDVLVAVEMNGAPIPPLHGGPLRLVVPGWYGMASVKWLRAIVALTRPFTGRFQTESYVYDDGPVTTMKVNSLIVTPSEDARLSPGRHAVWGWAWSGDAPIDFVAISFDAGLWQPATLSRAIGPRAWVQWEALIEPRRGRHSLRVRAGDRAGHVQPEMPPANRLGYGNNSVATVIFSCPST